MTIVKPYNIAVPILAAMSLVAGSAHASMLSVSFQDPVGDFMSFPIDLIGMTLEFDNVTGNYALIVDFDAANPFQGTFNVNANLLNGSISPLTVDPAFVNINRIPTSAAPTTQLVLTGNNPRLTSWGPGDSIATDASVFGLPIDATFSDFGSGVQNGGQPIDPLGAGASTIVPEPGTALLLSLGLVALASRRKRST